MNKELGEKCLDSAAKKMNYNLETFDSEFLKYSTAICGLLIWLSDKILQTKTIFLISVSLLLLLIISKIVSYKIAAVSQENYINFISSEDKNVEDRLKFFNIYKKTDALAEFLNIVSLVSFVFACLCILYIFFEKYYC
jgi:F0F1-type ATP synthase assembly protein I